MSADLREPERPAINEGLQRLQILFNRASSLPALPSTALRLIAVIDKGEASAIDLERIISSDACLAAMLLRIVGKDSSGASGSNAIRNAVMRLGQKVVRSLAVSLAIRQVIAAGEDGTGFDKERFAHHSLAVGFISRYLITRKTQLGQIKESAYSPDEIFAAGVLHDLAIALLASASPSDYGRLAFMAKRTGTTIGEVFAKLHGVGVGSLGAIAARTWGLPPLFAETMESFMTPWAAPKAFDALSCVCYADYLAVNRFSLDICDFPVSSQIPAEVAIDFDLSQNELDLLHAAVVANVELYSSIAA